MIHTFRKFTQGDKFYTHVLQFNAIYKYMYMLLMIKVTVMIA